MKNVTFAYMFIGLLFYIINSVILANEVKKEQFEPLNYYADTHQIEAAAKVDIQPNGIKNYNFGPDISFKIMQFGRGSGRAVSRTYIYVWRKDWHDSVLGWYLAFAYCPYSDYVIVEKEGNDIIFKSIYELKMQKEPIVLRLPYQFFTESRLAAYDLFLEEKTKR
jgi:hypothetical protein